MRISKLRSTTSLVISTALLAAPLAAQETAEANDTMAEPTLCVGLEETDVTVTPDADATDDTEVDAEVVFPCLDPTGAVIADQEALDAAIVAQMEAMVAEDVAEADAAEPATEEVESAEAAEAVAEDVPTEDISEDAAIAEAVDEEAVADETATEEVVAAEAAPAEEVVEETPAEETAEAEMAEETPADATEDVTETAAETEAETANSDEALPEGDAEVDVVTEGLPKGDEDTAAVTEGLPEGDETDVTVSEGLPEGDETSEEPVTVVEDEAAPTAAAAAAAETTEDSDVVADDADIVVEEVGEDDVRTSDEDFATAATGNAATTDDGDEDGMSSFERAILLGLGAVVVGSVLDNGDEVVANSGDRIVVQREGELVVLKDDDVLLRQPGSRVRTQSFDDGSTITTLIRENGDRIVTIRAADGRVLRRTRVLEDGRTFVLFDDTEQAEPVDLVELRQPQDEVAPELQASSADVDSLRLALLANQNAGIDRTFSLRQIRQIKEVRELAPQVELDIVTFASGSAAIEPSQAEELTDLGLTLSNIIAEDPGQVFLIEGHTDAVGDAGYNLALSDRRAETVALALTEYFGVPPENLITQGYGETVLKVPTLEDERANRRAAVRNITNLLQ